VESCGAGRNAARCGQVTRTVHRAGCCTTGVRQPTGPCRSNRHRTPSSARDGPWYPRRKGRRCGRCRRCARARAARPSTTPDRTARPRFHAAARVPARTARNRSRVPVLRSRGMAVEVPSRIRRTRTGSCSARRRRNARSSPASPPARVPQHLLVVAARLIRVIGCAPLLRGRARLGPPRAPVRYHLPYRMLEVAVAASAVCREVAAASSADCDDCEEYGGSGDGDVGAVGRR
jgi:hypothetical protein